MKSFGWPLAAVLVALAGGAQAEDLIAQRPGLMCSDPKGLAQLTMPDGSSKLKTKSGDKGRSGRGVRLAMQGDPGGCQNADGRPPPSDLADLLRRRGRPGIYVVPNIDFSDPVPSPSSQKSFAELRLHAAGYDLKANRSLGLTCEPASTSTGSATYWIARCPGP